MTKAFSCLFFSIALINPVSAGLNLKEQAKQAELSLVTITTVYSKPLRLPPQTRRPSATPKARLSYERIGTGIIINSSGLIVTNTHVIQHAPQILVTLHDGTQLKAKVVLVSKQYDFSFLKVDPRGKLKPLGLADSSTAQVGQNVIALGSSDHKQRKIIAGQILKILTDRGGAPEYIATNLTLRKGNSGGPVLDQKGQVLGIITAQQKSRGFSTLAIASNKIRNQYLSYTRKVP